MRKKPTNRQTNTDENITALAEVDCLVTTAGGIEEDFIKCMGEHYIGDFRVNDKKLRDDGVNRIGNMVTPNDNYTKFSKWIMPILDEMLEKQRKGFVWSPSKMITMLGEKINNKESVYYWAAKHKIPVFCPAITDGAIGDAFFLHQFGKKESVVLDIVHDIKRMHCLSVKSINTGVVILGGGLIKHHIMNSNGMRFGANYSVYINTGTEYDGSDAGARPEEAYTWGKIHLNASPVKLYAETTLVFPLLVAKTFAKEVLNH